MIVDHDAAGSIPVRAASRENALGYCVMTVRILRKQLLTPTLEALEIGRLR